MNLNYPEDAGADILLCSTANLEHVNTSMNESSYAVKQINEIRGNFDFPDPEERPNPHAGRMGWKPTAFGDEEEQSLPVNVKPSRFALPRPQNEPPINYLGQGDLDNIIRRIRDEEAQPPHKKNEARISALRQQAMEIMKRLESQWVEHSANRLLPRLDEGRAAPVK